MISRSNTSCRATAFAMASGSASHLRVEPSRSVNTSVTGTECGASADMDVEVGDHWTSRYNTVNGAELVAVPAAVVRTIGPVVAPTGTIATTCVFDVDTIVAALPLNRTLLVVDR